MFALKSLLSFLIMSMHASHYDITLRNVALKCHPEAMDNVTVPKSETGIPEINFPFPTS